MSRWFNKKGGPTLPGKLSRLTRARGLGIVPSRGVRRTGCSLATGPQLDSFGCRISRVGKGWKADVCVITASSHAA